MFGFSHKDTNKEDKTAKASPSHLIVTMELLLVTVAYGYGIDMDQTGQKDYDLIRGRSVALHPEVDIAIEDIVNEAIVSDTNDTPVNVDLQRMCDRIKTYPRRVSYILNLLDFNNKPRCSAVGLRRSFVLPGY